MCVKSLSLSPPLHQLPQTISLNRPTRSIVRPCTRTRTPPRSPHPCATRNPTLPRPAPERKWPQRHPHPSNRRHDNRSNILPYPHAPPTSLSPPRSRPPPPPTPTPPPRVIVLLVLVLKHPKPIDNYKLAEDLSFRIAAVQPSSPAACRSSVPT